MDSFINKSIRLIYAGRAGGDIAKEWGVLLKSVVTEIFYSQRVYPSNPRGVNSFVKAGFTDRPGVSRMAIRRACSDAGSADIRTSQERALPLDIRRAVASVGDSS
jgi:hypothetical protein